MIKKKFKTILISILIIGLIILYLIYENNTLQLTNYEIINSKIPNEFNDYKIAQISDFHNTNSSKLTTELVNKLIKIKPNIIVITGDFIDSRKTNIDISINFINKIKNICPIYYVNGNHESRISNYNELKTKLHKNNVFILENNIISLKKDNSKINLIGINDPSMKKYSNNEKDRIKASLNAINIDNSNYNILLSHRPEFFDIYSDYNIDLIFSGHAHGGQIRIPFVGGLIAPNQGIFPKYTNGINEKNNSKMIVSRGIGNSIFPFRINNLPELIIVTLKNKK